MDSHGFPINCLQFQTESEFPSSLADPAITSLTKETVFLRKDVFHLAMAPTSPLIPVHAYLARTQGCVEGSFTDHPLRVSGMRVQSPDSPVFILLASLQCYFALLCTWFEGEVLNILSFQRRENAWVVTIIHPPLSHVYGTQLLSSSPVSHVNGECSRSFISQSFYQVKEVAQCLHHRGPEFSLLIKGLVQWCTLTGPGMERWEVETGGWLEASCQLT